MQRSKYIDNQIQKLPKKPGVYFFKNKSGEVLYVGKATSLRDRVRSYWSKELNRGLLIEKMVGLVDGIEYSECDSEMEAIILEANYIKHYFPKYNIKLKDDKGFYFVKISSAIYGAQDVSVIHKNELINDEKGVRYFGPYISSRNLQIAMKFMRSVFPYNDEQLMFSKSNVVKKPRTRPIGHSLPKGEGWGEGYANREINKLFKRNIKHIIALLEGKKDCVIASLQNEMRKLARQKKYEEASIVRDKFLALQHLKNTAQLSGGSLKVIRSIDENVPYRIEGYDVSNTSGKEPVVSMVVFIEGKPKKSLYQKFIIRDIVGPNDTSMLAEAIARRFSSRHLDIPLPVSERNQANLDSNEVLRSASQRTQNDKEKWNAPNLIVIDGGKGQVNAVQFVLVGYGLTIPLIGLAKGRQRKKEDLYFINDSGFRDLHILRSVRDEAHRFAISFHRQRRTKNLIKSKLNTITGIGSKTSHRLLQQFGSYNKVMSASKEDLQKKVGSKIAEKIKKAKEELS